MIDFSSPIVLGAATVIVIVLVALLIYWLRRNYKAGKITLKAGPVETEFERKNKESAAPASAASATAATAAASSTPSPVRTQEMIRTEDSEQSMHGKAGVQKQKMTDVKNSKQHMD